MTRTHDWESALNILLPASIKAPLCWQNYWQEAPLN